MKKILLLLLIPFYSFTQALPVKEGKVIYEHFYSVPGLSRAELYTRAKNWVVNVFKNAQPAIQIDDKDAGQLIGKGSEAYSFKNSMQWVAGMTYFSMRIDCNDNQAQIRFYDITASNVGGTAASAEQWNSGTRKIDQKVVSSVDKLMTANLASFQQTITLKP